MGSVRNDRDVVNTGNSEFGKDALKYRCVSLPGVDFEGFVAIVGFGKGRFDMPDWMMGVGFIVLLIAPCVVAMRVGIENAEDWPSAPAETKATADSSPFDCGKSESNDSQVSVVAVWRGV